MSAVNLKMIHSSFSVPLDLAALNHSPVCCLPFAFLFKCRHQFCGADCPVRHVKLLSGFGLHKKKDTFSTIKSLSLLEQVSLEPQKSTGYMSEELGPGAMT